MFLVGYAGALRRSEVAALDVEHVTWTRVGMKLLIERSKTDAEGAGAEIAIPRGQSPWDLPGDDIAAVVDRGGDFSRPSRTFDWFRMHFDADARAVVFQPIRPGEA